MNKTRNLRIKDIFNVVSGATPSSKVESFWDGDVIWVTPADMTDFGYIESGSNNITLEGYNSCGTQYVPKGSIIISSRAPIGKINIAQNKLCTNQGCKSLVLSTKEVNSKYVAYYLYNVVEEINSLGQGTTFNELPLKRLVSFNVKLPSKDEQQHIVDYLDEKLSAIDKRVENLEKQKNAYARLKKSVIHQAVTRGLNPDVPLKDSGIDWIGMIPEHWEIKRMKDIFPKYSTGLTPESKVESNYSEDERYTWITIGDMNSKVVSESFMCLSEKVIKEKSPVQSPQGSLLFSFKLSIGKTAFAGKNLYTNEAIITLPPRKSIELDYYYYVIPKVCMNNATENIYGAKMLNQKIIANMLFVVPPLSEQKSIANYLDEKCAKIDAAIENISKQIDASKRLKRALINEVITGHRAV